MPEQSQIDELSRLEIQPQSNLIDGKKCASSTGETIDVHSPIDGSLLTTIASSAGEDVDAAVGTARAAFDSGVWSDMAPKERKSILLKWAELIERDALALTVLGVRDNGTEFGMAYKAEAGSAVGTIRYYAEAIDKIYGEIAPTGSSSLGLVHKEPVGVVGVIVPWNFPLMIGTWKLAPALAAGNTVVIKPPEIASLTLLRIADLALEAGMPPGVLNVVTGPGSITGEALALSMDVDVLAFTGSGGVGRRLLEYSARSNLKRVYLELGGKSPQLVFNDIEDLAVTAKTIVGSIFRNSGQVCIAASRLLVQREIHDELIAEIAAQAAKLRVGNPLDLGSQIGAVSSPEQLSQNLRHVARAQEQGSTLACGGNQILAETGGTYMEPTIFTEVGNTTDLMQQEVFGPVLAVTSFADEDEAIALANDSDFGLASGVWTSNLSRAHRMVRRLKAGLVHVNTYGGSDITVPLGGMKQSGNGHDKSLHAFDKYLDLKTAWFAL